MKKSGANFYWAVWDEIGISNSDRFPLWYAYSSDWYVSSFTRITLIHTSWGDFSEMNVIHFEIHGPTELILITKKTGESHYYIDVLDVGEMLSASSFAKSVNPQQSTLPQMVDFNINPNPFNNSCELVIQLVEEISVFFEVVNIKGERVYCENLGKLASGEHRLNWGGKNANEQIIPSGIYLFKINAGTEKIVKSAIFLK